MAATVAAPAEMKREVRQQRAKMSLRRKRALAPLQQQQVNGLYVHSSPPRVVQMNPSTIRQWLRGGDLERLEQVVLEGHGHRLVGEYSPEPRVRAFLKTVPDYMARIELVHDAASRGDLEELQAQLQEAGGFRRLAQSKDAAGLGLAHKAVLADDERMLRWLLDAHPAAAGVKDREGRTALHYCSGCADPRGMWSLLEAAGADVGAVDSAGHTAAFYMQHPEQAPARPSHSAANDASQARKLTTGKEGFVVTRANIRIWIHDRDMGRLQQMLWEGHGDKLRVETSNNPRVRRLLVSVPYIMGTIRDVHMGAVTNDLALFQMRSADPVPVQILASKDQNGLTPLHKAAGLGHERIVDDVLERLPTAVSSADHEGRQPLHYAAALRDGGAMYGRLVAAGADEQALDNRGRPAAWYRAHPGELDARLLSVIPEAPRTASVVPPGWDWRIAGGGAGAAAGVAAAVAASEAPTAPASQVTTPVSPKSKDDDTEPSEEVASEEQVKAPEIKKAAEGQTPEDEVDEGVGEEGDNGDDESGSGGRDSAQAEQEEEQQKGEIEKEAAEESSGIGEGELATELESSPDETVGMENGEEGEKGEENEGPKTVSNEEKGGEGVDEETGEGTDRDAGNEDNRDETETEDYGQKREEMEREAAEREEAEREEKERQEAERQMQLERERELERALEERSRRRRSQEVSNEELAETNGQLGDEDGGEEGGEDGGEEGGEESEKEGGEEGREEAGEAGDEPESNGDHENGVGEEQPVAEGVVTGEGAGHDVQQGQADVWVRSEEEDEGEQADDEDAAGEDEQQDAEQEKPEDSEQAGDEEVPRLVAAGDVDQLAAMVLSGDGARLAGLRAHHPDVQAFLDNVPAYMEKIAAVHAAARAGSVRELQAALDRRRFAVARDAGCPARPTPLHAAALLGHTDVVRYLGARFPETLAATDARGRTPLHYAACLADNGHYYHLLTALGARADALDQDGHTPEYYLQHPDELSHRQLLQDIGADEAVADNLVDKVGSPDRVSSRRDLEEETARALLRCYQQLDVALAARRHLPPQRFQQLSRRQTRRDHCLLDVIWPAARRDAAVTAAAAAGNGPPADPDQLDEAVYLCGGALAPDAESYAVFAELMVPLACELHVLAGPHQVPADHPPSSFRSDRDLREGDDALLALPDVDSSGKCVRDCTGEVCRNLDGLPLPLGMTLSELEMVERKFLNELEGGALEGGDVSDGVYVTLQDVLDGRGDLLARLRAEGLAIPLPPAQSVGSASLINGPHWPHGRGVFLSADGEAAVWLNVQEHLRVVVRARRPADCVARLERALARLSAAASDGFARDRRLGFVVARPCALGCALTLTARARLPRLSRDQRALRRLCAARGLRVGTAGPAHAPPLLLLSARRLLGVDESTAAEEFCTAVANVVQLEQTAAASEGFFGGIFKKK
ncbi:uncharacterized protein LOC126474660 [Schistocerca serialis cubense]|uniref:uncharacterized protein LOC126474660 n=1 Tax=Schistocerca serialis cubense TaxID=2023355 RepID=UPI00214F2C84|nr:uncharacterized protein LOC126474660 [Schistocerca serialis cubense]